MVENNWTSTTSSTSPPPSNEVGSSTVPPTTSLTGLSSYTTTPSPNTAYISDTSSSAFLSTSSSSSGIFSSAETPQATGSNNTTVIASSQSKGHSTNFSSGTLAGAIVGSFVGGLLLALLIAFLFIRPRKKSDQNGAGTGSRHGDNISKGPVESVTGVSSLAAAPSPVKPLPIAAALGSRALDLSLYAPQPADDSAVCMRIQVLLDQASLHIDNYYARTSPNPPLSSDIVNRLSHYDSSDLPASLVTMLSSPKAQRPVLIHTLVKSTLQAIQPGAQGLSLLPDCYAHNPRPGLTMADTSTNNAIFAWRMLTFYLYNHNQTAPTTSPEAIAEFAENFTMAFAPYSNTQFSKTERLHHLTNVTKAACELGVWLFSQPCSIEFRWTGAGFTKSQIVTIPALVKVSDENGERLVVPQTLSEETTVHIW